MSIAFPDSLDIPEPVLAIARTLHEAGHGVWAVGGAIRDTLLGYPNNDFDLATSATPKEVRKLFRRTVPVGLEHGTIAVLDRAGTPHEVTTFRRDVKTDGRHAVVEFGVSLEEDLARRDFTINAIAYHPLSREWRDPFSGAADLEAKLVRAVGEPHQRFREDYLRILRALRFAARFGFEIDGPTWEAARAEVHGLKYLSAERVRDEWFKGLRTARDPADLCLLWCRVGALPVWLPDVQRAACNVQRKTDVQRAELNVQRAEQNVQRAEQNVQRATVNVQRGEGLSSLPRDPVLITAYLSDDPESTLRRLKCSNAEIERGRRIGEHRGAYPDPADEVAVRRWLATTGPAADDLVHIAAAETADTDLRDAVERVRESGAPLTLGDLAISGDDLLALGVPKGPEVGRRLRALHADVLERPELNERDALLERAKGQTGQKRQKREKREKREKRR